MRIVFMGSGDIACRPLERLLAHPDYIPVAVVSQPDRPRGRHQRVGACPVKALAAERGVTCLAPVKIGAPDAVAAIRDLAPDLLVVAAYGQFIPPAVLAIPPLKSINLHPSLLPKYRGATPIQWALANGDTETGVTILYVEEAMDSGDILVQRRVAIDPEDTAETLTPRLAAAGAEALIEALDAIRDGTAVGRPQDPAAVTTVYKLNKADGLIDWSRSAAEIRNRIRGFTPWPGCYTLCHGRLLKVRRARVEAVAVAGAPGTVVGCAGDGPVVATGDGWLVLTDVQPEGRTVMSGAAFLCGHTLKPGDRLG